VQKALTKRAAAKPLLIRIALTLRAIRLLTPPGVNEQTLLFPNLPQPDRNIRQQSTLGH
jgi:hypothetical protein